MQTLSLPLEITPFLIILLGAVFVHACFQLSVSVLTLLSSHTIGRRLPNNRLLGLNFWYILGVIVMIASLVLGMMATQRWALTTFGEIAFPITLGAVPVIALLMALLYYRRGRGTRLWLPRGAAEYITARAKRTKSGVESFSLGMTTAVTELPFAVAPLAIVGLALQGFAAEQWLRLALGYAVAVSLPLVFVSLYLSSGHTISSIQRWREDAKGFLSWASAAALLLLTLYMAVLQFGGSA